MNRNLRSELLTAIFVIAGIFIAIGAIIALSSSPDGAIADLTPTTISMVESPVDNSPTGTIADMTAQVAPIDDDETEIVPSEITPPAEPTDDITATSIPTRIDTIIRETPTQLASNTPILPTQTPRLTNTPKPTNLAIRETPTGLPSNTPIPPTRTPRSSSTPIPPTATPTENISTNTPIPPTQTPSPTRTPRPSSTPIPPSVTPTATIETTNAFVAEGCLNPSIQITSPRPNDRLSDVFDVIGTATLPNFGLYRIEIRPDDAFTYQRINAVQEVVYADVLAQIDPSDYPSGIYWIRLVVVDNRGAIAENGTCAIPTIFE